MDQMIITVTLFRILITINKQGYLASSELFFFISLQHVYEAYTLHPMNML